MKSLQSYIIESNESDILFWQLDNWFINNDKEKQEFINIIIQCQNDHTINNVEKYLDNTNIFKNNYKQLIDFILNDIEINKELDYIYQLKELIKTLMNNKSYKNSYNKQNLRDSL